ncbi:hypothetical protein [Dyadobacter frigoris]|uniref:hypothetical protein n=1 Tax=Dyadobacter frigoris TaxID=2576211 RepID=UPI00255277A9|nr:hypothetical protein [Dyadobacter frigoris]
MNQILILAAAKISIIKLFTMILLGNPSYSDLLCGLLFFLGFALRFWVAQRRFNRKKSFGNQQFKSYFNAMLILFIERVLTLFSLAMILGPVLWFFCT